MKLFNLAPAIQWSRSFPSKGLKGPQREKPAPDRQLDDWSEQRRKFQRDSLPSRAVDENRGLIRVVEGSLQIGFSLSFLDCCQSE